MEEYLLRSDGEPAELVSEIYYPRSKNCGTRGQTSIYSIRLNSDVSDRALVAGEAYIDRIKLS